MSGKRRQKIGHKLIFHRISLFPVIVLIIYAVLFIVSPDKAILAARSSGSVLISLLIPLGLIFVLMLLINLFLNPAKVAQFLGKGSGIKGIGLSVVAGIISTGPIYAWYPLLKDLKEKGAGDSLIAIFLYNRAIKPFLLPVMVTYFGWLYVAILTLLIVSTSVVIGSFMRFFPSSKEA
ncbi:MAG: hypothetical protein JW882_19745 [Deltaproteobacteria bacterium]|nr:hypothetical protein [Deltaproteobacteria bacterium]